VDVGLHLAPEGSVAGDGVQVLDHHDAGGLALGDVVDGSGLSMWATVTPPQITEDFETP
jgi:hypothetical protein